MDPQRARELLEAERSRLQEIQGSGLAGDFGEAEQETDSDVLSYQYASEHPSDAAKEVLDREEALTVIDAAGEEMVEVEHALHKLDEGTYGLCEACGNAIPDERLEARPATRFDIEHQRIEEKMAGPSDPLADRSQGEGGGQLARPTT